MNAIYNLMGSILESLAETGGQAPEGVMYAALQGRVTHAQWTTAMRILRNCGLVTVSPACLVTITADGRETAAECAAAREEEAAR
jgi:hypothetical protein